MALLFLLLLHPLNFLAHAILPICHGYLIVLTDSAFGQNQGGTMHPSHAIQGWPEIDTDSIFYLVDTFINFPRSPDMIIFSERGSIVSCYEAPLEAMVAKWTKDHPVIWSVGIGAVDSFVPTLTRLLFEGTKDLYGPYDYIIRVRLTPAKASEHWVMFEVLMQWARVLKIPPTDDEFQELVAEEIYFGYGTLSEDIMVKAFGRIYMEYFGSHSSIGRDPNYGFHPFTSPILDMIRRVCQDKGHLHLVLVENLDVPLVFHKLDLLLMRPQMLLYSHQRNRWIISTTSKDVYDKSLAAFADRRNLSDPYNKYLNEQYYHAPPFHDLANREWVMLIKEALRDAAGSIYNALLQQQQDSEFWLQVAQQCLYFSILYHSELSSVTSDELVRCWVAESLLFSTTSPIDIPATTGKKQSNYYRSAYKVGKVVIDALQEYSLLQFCSSVCTPKSTSPSPQNVITGVSKLAMGVPGLTEDELFDHEISNRLRWVSFMDDNGRHISWNWRFEGNAKFIPGEMTMTTLVLRGCSNLSAFPFDKVLSNYLRVLDLSYTLIDTLPPSFSCLLNLHLLSLRGCSKLETLSPPPPNSEDATPPLAHLGNLQVLDMNGVPLLELTQQDVSNKSSLHYLDLSGSRVITLPSKFFSEMSSLEELILGNCSNLHELPPSLAKLSNLLILCVAGTQISNFPEDTFEEMQRLHTLKLINNKRLISLPLSLSKATGLKEIHIYNCTRIRLHYLLELVPCLEGLYIETWQALESIKIHGHPNLTTLSLSGRWIRRLSLRGCRKLKTVNFSDDITSLVAVDLSETAIEEVPHNLPNQPQLRMLLLLNVPCFKRFPWHQLVRFPKVFCLSHCEDDDTQFSSMFDQQEICSDENKHTENTMNTTQININDSRMFHSFNADAANKLVKEQQFLQSFNIQVKPCSARGKERRNKEVELCTNIQRLSPYSDAIYSEAASIMPMLQLQSRQRHVEISAMDRYPRGLRQLLSVAQSLFITDDAFLRCLTDLNYALHSLVECQLQHCHEMRVVFRMFSETDEALSSLELLQVSDLENLVIFVELPMPDPRTDYFEMITLKVLKHIHLENCPRLEKIFPCTLSLPALESLVILFCTNLKTIFYKQPKYEVAPSPLPNIKRMYLQELPQLHLIHEDAMFAFEAPNWETLFVRGCQSFQHLPLLKKECQKTKVKVSGERDWWDKLQFSLLEQRNYYLQVPPPEFASRKKGVVIKSYLR